MKIISRYIAIVVLMMMAFSCSTEIDINAPEKPIWAVYGVLNQDAPAQFIRISMGFLPESNAFEYAKENDLSVKDLRVTLTGTSGKIYQATQVDSVLKEPADGTFISYTTLYRFDTEGAEALNPGEEFTLRITKMGNDDFELHATTSVPLIPRISRPSLTLCSGNGKGLQAISLDKETRVEWSDNRPSDVGKVGKAFELRAFLAYQEDGIEDTVKFGPSRMIDNKACASQYCYRFREKELLSTFLTRMNQQPGAIYTYVDTPTCSQPELLATSFWYEVTALDTFLYRYRLANDPLFTDFNTTRPEFSNILGTETVIGIFGAISITRQYAAMNKCSRYLLNLNGERQPNIGCSF
jgi:hypothetical protein